MLEMVHMLGLVNGQIQDHLQIELTQLIGDTAWTNIDAMNLSSGYLLLINRLLHVYNINIIIFNQTNDNWFLIQKKKIDNWFDITGWPIGF